jgi:hypothetical protein
MRSHVAGADAVAAAFTALVELDAAQAELITAQAERIAVLEAELEELERLLGRNSSNSGKAPSGDSPEAREQRPKKPSSGRKPGGQPGHEATGESWSPIPTARCRTGRRRARGAASRCRKGQFARVTVSPGLRRVASIGGTGENRARGETKGSGSL